MSDYRVLVTGGSRGIGRGIALALANKNFSVAVNALEPDAELDATLTALRALGVKAAPVIGDVSDISRSTALLDEAEAAIGPLTTLVNNAGVSALNRGDILDVTPESYDRCQSVNARGVFFLTQAWAKRILSRAAPAGVYRSVITVSSSNAVAVSLNRSEYCASKAAAAMIAKAFAVRLGGEGVGSYDIQPGLIETPMTTPSAESYRQRIAQGLTVVPRMGQPSDIGSIAAALATGQLAFCTGQALQADGGLVISRF